ncbi:coniferyl aldehyde dehydrogenase [Halorhodospira sp. 9621]|uniref:coniferyl aldehyde dehydrogenase n=1 Tax=Halorhodospira sp. 9621 TaxID=2899135 RepID=UPI001EE7F5D0|nr:coniferyl aldehyde dehydrogenase [Halorhodospira sp. 9621]MCG5533191.1 coniferyl aldehyde dehydrogenase [Halorhodospira sp. 9621]
MGEHTPMPEDQAAELQTLLDRQRQAFAADPAPSLAVRRGRLDRLRRAVLDHREALTAALDEDFGGRSVEESTTVDLLPALTGIRHAQRHLRRWMRLRRRWPHPLMQPASAWVHDQPLGVVGIMVPWNYPVYLALSPLTGALAAGNRVLLKLSELTPATNAVLGSVIRQAFSAEEVAVVEGGESVSRAFAALPFDHLLFTGSTAVGRQVMAAAAAHLTPVTLELGGKSPAVVDGDADLDTAAGRIAYGKLLNAGQTCIAPDYVLCTPDRRDALVDALRRAATRLYPDPLHNPDYAAVITRQHRERLEALLTDAREQGAELVSMAEAVENAPESGRMPPWLVLDAPASARVLEEEIFGPVLPVVTVADLEQALAYIRARPRPLALYYFGHDRRRQQQVLDRSHSGGVCINDTVLHVAQDNLPFGGVGASGMGLYHGFEGFRTFSNEKAVLRKGRWNSARLVEPPYGRRIHRWVRRLMVR